MHRLSIAALFRTTNKTPTKYTKVCIYSERRMIYNQLICHKFHTFRCINWMSGVDATRISNAIHVVFSLILLLYSLFVFVSYRTNMYSDFHIRNRKCTSKCRQFNCKATNIYYVECKREENINFQVVRQLKSLSQLTGNGIHLCLWTRWNCERNNSQMILQSVNGTS